MKLCLMSLLCLFTAGNLYSQSGSVAINNDGGAPNSKAMLDIESTEKGLLIPRMTRTQREAITSPPTGLLVYQIDERAGFYYNAGNFIIPNWISMSRSRDTITIGSEAFFPSRSSEIYNTSALHIRYLDAVNSTASLYAPIALPSGATVLKVAFYFQDNSPTGGLNFELEPLLLNSGATFSAGMEVSSTGYDPAIRVTSFNPNHGVKTSEYSYRIRVSPTGTGWSGTNNMGIKNVMVIYER